MKNLKIWLSTTLHLVISLDFLPMCLKADGHGVGDHSTFIRRGLGDRFIFDDSSQESDRPNAEVMMNLKTNKVNANSLSFPDDVGKITGKSKMTQKSAADLTDFLESFLVNPDRDFVALSTETKIPDENLLFDNSSKFHKQDDPGFSMKQNNESDQVLSRRQVSDSWQVPLDIVETDPSPWTYESYYPRDSKYAANYYEDYAYIPSEISQPKNFSESDFSKSNYKNHQQFLRNNYYYSDYGSRRNHKSFEYKDGLDHLSRKRGGINLRKFISRNSCRQYLEFLRYAFQKLDENPEYRDEYESDYNDNDEEDPGRNNNPYDIYQPSHRRLNVDNSNLGPRMQSKDPQQITYESAPHTYRTPSSRPTQTIAPPSNPFLDSATPTTSNYGIPNSITTQTPWTSISESYSSTRGQTEKETVTENHITTLDSSTTVTPKIIFEKKDQKFNNSLFRTTTKEVIEKHRTEFQNYEKTTTPASFTATPRWLFPENYFRNLGNSLSETPATRTTPPNWITYATTAQKDPITTTPKYSTNDSKKEDADCDDKALPCPDIFNVTYPLNGYCNKYVSCESGRAIRRTCPEGLHFNILTKSCDLPHNSFCNYACAEPDGYYGIPGDCMGYFVCKNSFAEYRMCPPGMHWDTTHDICTFVESSACPMKCIQPNGVLHYKGDCKGYIICLNGIPYYHKCPPNTKFDRSASTCIPDRLSKCTDDPKLMTRIMNPNHLCRDTQMKFGSEIWCDYYKSKEKKD